MKKSTDMDIIIWMESNVNNVHKFDTKEEADAFIEKWSKTRPEFLKDAKFVVGNIEEYYNAVR